MRKKLLTFCLALCMILPVGAQAAAYPTKAVTLIAPFGPGGAADLEGRAFAQVAPKYVGQPVLAVNKDGAGGIIGSQWVRMQKPDGYTLLAARVGPQGTVPALNLTIPYKWDQFTMIGLTQLDPFVYVVKADSPYKTLSDLINAMKAAPGKISFSTSGPSGLLALGSQMLVKEAGLDPIKGAKMVPFKGGGAAMTALLGGHVDFLGCNLGEANSQIKAGTLRALAVTSKERFSGVPDVPTVGELGFPALEAIVGWTAIFGPEKLPKEVVDFWVTVLQKVAKDPEWLKMTNELGSIPDVRSPEETKKFVQAQYELYYKLGQDLGIQVK